MHRPGILAFAAIFLLFAGMLTAPLKNAVRGALSGTGEAGAGRHPGGGVSRAGLLGPVGALTADAFWLRMAGAWEKQDRSAVEMYIRMAIVADPGASVFARDGARILAYDVPRWRVRQFAVRTGRMPSAAVTEQIYRDEAKKSLSILERAAAVHPGNARIVADAAMLHLNRLDDVEGAARLFRQAAEIDGAPRFTVRIYGRLLRQLGRFDEAYQWYISRCRGLSGSCVDDQDSILLERILELEELLDVPPGRRFLDASG
jgi:hypothetical protein